MAGQGDQNGHRCRVNPATQGSAGSDEGVSGAEVPDPAPRAFRATVLAALCNPLDAVPADDHPVMVTEVGNDTRVGVGRFLM